MTFATIRLLDIPLTSARLEELVEDAVRVIRSDDGGQIVFACANPHSIVEARRDSRFFEALNDADHVVADGIGATLALRIKGDCETPRITGSDYFAGVMAALDSRGIRARIAFLGSSEEVLNLIQTRFAKDFPNLTLVSMISPPFGPWSEVENQRIVDRLNAARPDVIWVGMTAPKQECWSYANRRRLQAKLIGNVGAVFDFYAGTKPRAPAWACKAGVEWLYRWLKEPRRMWRRNLVSMPLFLWYFGASLRLGQKTVR